MDFACGMRNADEPLQGILCRRRQQRIVAGKKFMDEVVAECKMSEAARKAAASRMMRAIGIEVVHKKEYMMATLVQEVRSLWRILRMAHSY